MQNLITLFVFTILISFSINAQQKIDIDKLNQYFDLLDKHNKIMGSINIAQGEEIVYERHVGLANIEVPIENSAEIKYRVGSISKVFTSVLIFQLIEEEKISLKSKISVFFPNLPNAENISISNLLNHSSGIFNLTNDENFRNVYTKPQSRKQLLGMIEGFEPAFETDSKHEYSNSNYVLLTLIIEALTGKSYGEIVEEKIVNKIGLENTYLGKEINIVNKEASSYSYEGTEWKVEPESDMSIPLGAGGMVSNPNDLNKFLKHLFDEKLVSSSSLQAMQDFEKDGYGRGLFKNEIDSIVVIGHSGAIDAFLANASYIPEKDLYFTVTTNGIGIPIGDVVGTMGSIILGLPVEMPNFDLKQVEIVEEELEKYDGVYACSGFPLEITLTTTDGVLYAQATGQDAFPLKPYEDRHFKFDLAGITLIFGEDEKGGVDYKTFVMKQGAGKYEFKRK